MPQSPRQTRHASAVVGGGWGTSAVAAAGCEGRGGAWRAQLVMRGMESRRSERMRREFYARVRTRLLLPGIAGVELHPTDFRRGIARAGGAAAELGGRRGGTLARGASCGAGRGRSFGGSVNLTTTCSWSRRTHSAL